MRKRLLIIILLIVISAFLAIGTANAAPNAKDASDAADKLYTLGLLSGIGSNTDGSPDFALDRPVTRAEAIVIVVKLIGKETEALEGSTEAPYIGVPDWATPYVGFAYGNDLLKSVCNTFYGVGNYIPAGEFAHILHQAVRYVSEIDLSPDDSSVLASDAESAGKSGNTEASVFLRGDMALIALNALTISNSGSDKTLCSWLIDAGVITQSAAINTGLIAGTAPVEAESNTPSPEVEINTPPTPGAEMNAQLPGPDATTPADDASVFERAVFDLFNIEREKHGLQPLQWDAEVSVVASAHSADMSRRGYFSHENPEGATPSDRVRAAGINYMYAGEVLARAYKTPESVVAAWMASPSHRKVILSNYATRVGIGIVGEYWTADFIG